MQTVNVTSPVANVTSAELRDFIKSHPESEYVLVDVRQAEEYQCGHIAGAQHIPLNELEGHASELKQLANRHLIFYCRGGARSSRASAWAAQVLGLPKVMNLVGGFLGWEGPGLIDFPRLASFDLNGSVESLLRQAFQLEQGTHHFYELLAAEHRSGIVGETLASLLIAELAHASVVHQLLREADPNLQESFEGLLARAPGSLLEDGLSFEAALSSARQLGRGAEMALLELLLDIELGAYDLYKNLALKVSTEQSKSSLMDLAQQEKAHVDLVLRAISKLTKAHSNPTI